MINLVFEEPGSQAASPDPYVQSVGAQKFRLFEYEGRYPLPDVVLMVEPGMPTLPVREARIAGVAYDETDYGELRRALHTAWDAGARNTEWVAGRQEISHRRSLQADLLDHTLATKNGEYAEVMVTWRLEYTDRTGAPATGREHVKLEFAPRGVRPETGRGRRGDPESRRLGLPGPLRHRRATEPAYSGFAAVDFGTSASTVTLFDSRGNVITGLDEGQLATLRGQLAGLLTGKPPQHLGQAWSVTLAGLLKEVGTVAPEVAAGGAAALADQLAGRGRRQNGAPNAAERLFDAVCVAFENALVAAEPELRRWLAPRLLGAYDQAFRVPPLADYQLQQVEFTRAQVTTKEIASRFRVVRDNPIEIELGATTGPNTRQRLKSKLLKREELTGMTGADEREATTDDLIAHVYLHLVQDTEAFAHRDREGLPKMMDTVVVTYPTTTPPFARTRLRSLVKHCLDVTTVVTSYDEGVAAGLFFLMCDFGGNRREFGAETLRARSRRVADDPPTWRQNMLVLDIGAGTTDIALIRLTLIDQTEPIDGVDPAVQGRYYVIRPEVINSTGHAQLGGDYLTLRVFYWIKACIVDALVTGSDHEEARARLRDTVDSLLPDLGTDGPLGVRVAHAGVNDPVPAELIDVLREILPTHYPPGPDTPEAAKLAFQQLWELAEAAKIQLGADPGPDGKEHHRISREQLQSVLNPIDQQNRNNLASLLPAKGIRLARADFVALARPVLSQAVALARWLARTTLGDDPEERLDRVMLSGQTSKMELLQQVVVEDLPGAESDDRLRWNPAALTVEATYAKQAAAIGACWGHSLGQRIGGQKQERSELAAGRTLMSIDVENLFHTLPCSFTQFTLGVNRVELIEGGVRMAELTENTVGVRSAWRPLVPLFDVHRPIDDLASIQWGVFRFETYAEEKENFSPDPAIWLAKPSIGRESLVSMQLEVDQNLSPRVNICQGDPHYLVSGGLELRGDLRDQWDETEMRLRSIPYTLVVDTVDGRRPVFEPWDPATPVTERFPLLLHEVDELDSPAVHGWLSELLPSPQENGDYFFHLRRPDGSDIPLGPLSANGPRDAASARYRVTLDVRGRLSLHRGSPRYWKAAKLHDVERTPGAVFSTDMDRSEVELRDNWDPFSGKH